MFSESSKTVSNKNKNNSQVRSGNVKSKVTSKTEVSPVNSPKVY